MSIDIRVPDPDETPLSCDEVAIAIRDGVEPGRGLPKRAAVVISRNQWQPMMQVERAYPQRSNSWSSA